MNTIIRCTCILGMFLTLLSCSGQLPEKEISTDSASPSTAPIGGPFENGDFIYIDMPNELKAVDTSPGWAEQGKKLMITGTIFQLDGKTPAPGVILYYYQTNTQGIYAPSPIFESKAKRHGYIRGWVQTDEKGAYTIYTVRPGAYPTHSEPAHIHLTIKEPEISQEYYIHSLLFDDDPLLTTAFRKQLSNRGGSGILRLLQQGDLQVAEHDIILGLNIPNYPISAQPGHLSGRAIGEDISSFTPRHYWGPDKGKKTCPICKYGRHQGILFFVGNNHNWSDTKKWLSVLEAESESRGTFLKVYFIFEESAFAGGSSIARYLEELGASLKIKQSALTVVPSFQDDTSEISWNRINSDVSNTIILFRQSTIVDKFIDIAPTADNIAQLQKRLTETQSQFASLPTIYASKKE